MSNDIQEKKEFNGGKEENGVNHLIERWHGRDRSLFGMTAASEPLQMPLKATHQCHATIYKYLHIC